MDSLTSHERSQHMARIKGRDTGPEMLVRRTAHAMGYRYVLHDRRLPGKPDLVFRARKKAIFVHGCFWHQHPGCKGARTPKSRLDFWPPKLSANVARDARNLALLEDAGWDTLVLWECELRDRDALCSKLQGFLGSRGVV